MTDAELVARALAGDRDAFAALYGRYHAIVYRFARMMSGSHTVAEDVTQETFVALMRDLPRYDPGRAALATYLYGVARNVTRARLRRERRFVGLESGEEAGYPVDADPAMEMTASEVRQAVRRAIFDLPSRYREAVILCAIHGLSYHEAAVVLGVPVGTVRSRLSRGKRAMAIQLRKAEQTPARVARPIARCAV